MEALQNVLLFFIFRLHLSSAVHSDVSLFQKYSTSPGAWVCHATGFFPRTVNITWKKNGEDLNVNVELKETLPNQDGTFQKRSVLTVSPEDLDQHHYSCIVQHSSLEQDLVLQVSDHSNHRARGAFGTIGAAVAVLIIVSVGFFVWVKRRKMKLASQPISSYLESPFQAGVKTELIMKLMIFLVFTVQQTSAETHSLDFYLTGVTPGISVPEFTAVGAVDGLEGGYYNSISKKVVLTGALKNYNHDVEHWNELLQNVQAYEANFKSELENIMTLFNQTGGVHTLQLMTGCDGNHGGYMMSGYDGNDFLTLDLNDLTWIAANDKALIIKHQLDQTNFAAHHKAFLDNTCILWLKKYVDYANSTLEGKVPPEVYLFQRHSPSRVVCHATGFFPRAVMISWQKNGEDLEEDVDLRETLPNMDNTYQKTSVLTVSPEELDKHNYNCIVQHSSLEKEIVKLVVNQRVPAGVIIGVIIGAVVLVLLVVVTVGVVVWKMKRNTNIAGAQPSALTTQCYSRCMDSR